ncbi:Isoamylase isoform [Corchorus olitorius]|uniref:Isoamylase isoform n=1 Tax=Corchorus olitorius TaxID=93759 RepID=A0A1R3JEK5_9ROSI|nr:Isoamylase isoform [Corchorus olitorius]
MSLRFTRLFGMKQEKGIEAVLLVLQLVPKLVLMGVLFDRGLVAGGGGSAEGRVIDLVSKSGARLAEQSSGEREVVSKLTFNRLKGKEKVGETESNGGLRGRAAVSERGKEVIEIIGGDNNFPEGVGDNHVDNGLQYGEFSMPKSDDPIYGNIPGLGPIFGLGSTQQGGLQPGKRLKGNRQEVGELYLPSPFGKNQLLQNKEGSTEPFVFGSGSSSTSRSVRKWRKQARVTTRYSFDFLGPQTNFKAGRK